LNINACVDCGVWGVAVEKFKNSKKRRKDTVGEPEGTVINVECGFWELKRLSAFSLQIFTETGRGSGVTNVQMFTSVP
jgi:hypothetical protein